MVVGLSHSFSINLKWIIKPFIFLISLQLRQIHTRMRKPPHHQNVTIFRMLHFFIIPAPSTLDHVKFSEHLNFNFKKHDLMKWTRKTTAILKWHIRARIFLCVSFFLFPLFVEWFTIYNCKIEQIFWMGCAGLRLVCVHIRNVSFTFFSI